jgi:hypothetical protein
MLTYRSRFLHPILLFLSCLVLSASCSSGEGGSSSRKDDSNLPKARGATGEIVLVMDSVLWKGELGRQVRRVFSDTVPGLPLPPEPKFNLRYVDPFKLNRLLRSAKNMLFVTVFDNKSRASRKMQSYFTNESVERIKSGEDLFMYAKDNEFARGQKILHLFGASEKDLISNLKKNKAGLQDYFEEVEKNRLAEKIYSVKPERGIMNVIKEDFKCSLRIPYDFDIAKQEEDFIWIRQLDREVDKSFIISYRPYTSETAFEKENLIAWRNRIGKIYLADSKRVYMQTDSITPVYTREKNFNGHYAVEMRGLWRLSNNTMGGPFVSMGIVDEERNRFYYVEGYVYAPNKRKRNIMLEMETVLESFRILPAKEESSNPES